MPHHNATGIVLIEALIAIVLFMILVTTVAFYQSHIIGWYQEGIDRLHALSFASSYLEHYVRDPHNTPSVLADGKFSLTSQRKPYALHAHNNHNTLQLYILMVTVAWSLGVRKPQKVTLETGIIMSLKGSYV